MARLAIDDVPMIVDREASQNLAAMITNWRNQPAPSGHATEVRDRRVADALVALVAKNDDLRTASRSGERHLVTELDDAEARSGRRADDGGAYAKFDDANARDPRDVRCRHRRWRGWRN